MEFSCFFNGSTDIGNLISVSSAFSKPSLNIWMFTVHILLKPGLENFEHYLLALLELKVRKGSGEEIPLVQGKEQWLCFAGAAMKRYPRPKVRETQVRQ